MKLDLKFHVAAGVQLIRGFTAFAPGIKEKVIDSVTITRCANWRIIA